MPENRWLRRVAWCGYTFCILLVLLVGGLAGRLALGPINLEFAVPRMEEALNPSDDRYSVEIRSAVLAWEGWQHGLNLRARDVRINRADGTKLASLPAVSFTVDIWRLAGGEIAPSRITIRQPKLALVRSADGRVTLGLRESVSAGGQFVPSLLSTFSTEKPEVGSLRRLTEINIEGGELLVTDAAMGRTWQTDSLNARIRRVPAGISGELAFNLKIEERSLTFQAELAHDFGTDNTRVRLSFAGLDPQIFAAAEGPLRAFGWFRMPLNGAALVSVDKNRRVTGLGLEVTGGEGEVVVPQAYNEPLRVKSVSIRSSVSDDGKTLTLGPVTIDFGGPVLTLAGSVIQGASNNRFDGRAVFTQLPVNEIGKYWPRNLAWKGRRWVTENISDGVVPELSVDVRLSINRGPDAAMRVQDIDGRFAFEGISIRYIDALPPVTGVNGRSRFDDRGMTFRATAGQIDDIRIIQADAAIRGFDEDPPHMDLSARAAGPLPTILRVIDRPPLGYATELGANPSQVEGQAAVTFKASYPLIRTLELNAVKIDVQADLQDVTWRRGLFGRDVTGGQFALGLDKEGMTVKGPAALDGSAIDLKWRENFADGSETRRVLNLTGTLTPGLLAGLSIDLSGYFDGRADMNLEATGKRDGTNLLDARFDIAAASLRIPMLGLEKPRGEPGTARVSLVLQGERPVSLSRLEVDGEDLRVRAHAEFFENGTSLRRLVVEELKAGRTDIGGEIVTKPDGAQTIKLAGPSLDLVPIMEAEDPAPEGEEEATPALSLGAEIGRVFLSEGPPLENVRAALRYDGTFIRDMSLSGRPVDGAPVTVTLTAEGEGQVVRANTEEAGALARTLGIAKNMRGGTLILEARRKSLAEGVPYVGRLEVRDFRMIEAPALARLVVFRDESDKTIDPDQVDFEQLIAPFRFQNGVIEIRSGRANGSKIGLTFGGEIDIGDGSLELDGTAVPAYRLNSLLGKIPGLGRIIVGEKGSGILAARWHAEGSFEKPEVDVNTLSVLTPGFTRYLLDIFRGERDDEADFDAPPDYRFDLGP